MRVETAYGLGDVVWHLRTWNAKEKVECALCLGLGQVAVGATARSIACPDCWCRGYQWTDNDILSATITRLTIGQVRVSIDSTAGERTYMADETGVGSGTVYPEANLHATEEAAEMACSARGAVLIPAESEVPC